MLFAVLLYFFFKHVCNCQCFLLTCTSLECLIYIWIANFYFFFSNEIIFISLLIHKQRMFGYTLSISHFYIFSFLYIFQWFFFLLLPNSWNYTSKYNIKVVNNRLFEEMSFNDTVEFQEMIKINNFCYFIL
jgi:hypothetical protein